jgi:hypothetical protein
MTCSLVFVNSSVHAFSAGADCDAMENIHAVLRDIERSPLSQELREQAVDRFACALYAFLAYDTSDQSNVVELFPVAENVCIADMLSLKDWEASSFSDVCWITDGKPGDTCVFRISVD